ncbi:unnamed protein product [Nippostrongylus brasiliensis]|uniref:Uncharacterized protein n=1 Tax=Nippostrongylus brasiliensis TaxID=27835 RepID=A0A0N4YLJ3_NIPBR|nr:unnamed protein product [Nippostrongylus brasiliensis]
MKAEDNARDSFLLDTEGLICPTKPPATGKDKEGLRQRNEGESCMRL